MDFKGSQSYCYPCFRSFIYFLSTEILINTREFMPEEVNQLQSNPYIKQASFSTTFSTVAIPLRHIAVGALL